MKTVKSAFLSAMLVLSTACAPTQILTTTAFAPKGPAIEGIPYFLPLAQIPITVETKSNLLTITLEDAAMRPDPSAYLVASVNFKARNDDDIDISVTASGLLNALTVTSDDKADNIVADTTTAVANILSGSGDAFRTQSNGESPKGIKPGQYLLDPLQPLTSKRRANLAKARNGQWVPLHSHFGTAKITYLDTGFADRLLARSNARSQTCMPDASLCFPAVTPVLIRVTGDMYEVEKVYAIPDPTRSFGIRLDRRACVLSSYTIGINSGVMTKFDATKPSEIEGCLSIPLRILAAIIAAPVNAIKGKTAEITAQAALVSAQANLLAAQKAAE